MPSTPFNAAAKRAREQAFHNQVLIAAAAGITVGLYNAMELGAVQFSQAAYAAVIARYPQLRVYPRPGPDPVIITPTLHPIVTTEQGRIQNFHALFKQLNVGTTNRGIIRRMLELAVRGEITVDDIAWYF